MLKCPNCGQKTYGDSCQWCRYPLIRRRFPWQVGRGTRRKKPTEQAKLKVEQAIEKTTEKVKKEVEEEEVWYVTRSRHKVEQLAKELKEAVEAKREAERIIEGHTQKMKEVAGEEWAMATDKGEIMTAQIIEQTLPSQVGSSELLRHQYEILRDIQETDKIKVIVIDDQGLFRQGLRLFLSQTDDIELIAESDFIENTVSIIAELAPNLALIDINLPRLGGLSLAQRVSQLWPDISVIILTPYEDDSQILETLKAGASGYLSKDITPEELENAIRRVHKGERIIDELLVRPSVAQRVLKHLQNMEKELSIKSVNPQAVEMLGYFANGYSRKKVAQAMGVSEQQISHRVTSIISKTLLP